MVLQEKTPSMSCVLVIDDDAEVRLLMRRLLEPCGHEVIEAGTGVEGVHRCSREGPQLVITDLFMPEMDGRDVIRKIKKPIAGARILAVSGGDKCDLAVLDHAVQLGADGILAKPFTPEEFYSAVSALGCPVPEQLLQ